MSPFRSLEPFATQVRFIRPKFANIVRQSCLAGRCSLQPFEFPDSPLLLQGHLRVRSQRPHHIPPCSYIMSHLPQEWVFHRKVCNNHH
jgi:hypothetical protein